MVSAALFRSGFRWSRAAALWLAGLSVIAPALAATPRTPAPTRAAALAAGVSILKPVTLATGQNLTTGSVATTTATASGTEAIPASYPVMSTPQPSYSGVRLATVSGKIASPAAARIDLTGVAGTSVTVHVTGWRLVSGAGAAPAMLATSFYSPSNGARTSSIVVLDARGKASLYIGATLAIPAGAVPRVFAFSPVFSVNYN